MNFIFTLRGERLYDPDYGTDIPTMTFEQLDDTTLLAINKDLNRAFAAEPRVTLLRCDVVSNADTHSIIAHCHVLYVDYGVEESFDIQLKS